jgi:hypothetical protein
MAVRKNAGHGLVDGRKANLGGPRTAALLDRLDKAVPWTELAGTLPFIFNQELFRREPSDLIRPPKAASTLRRRN